MTYSRRLMLNKYHVGKRLIYLRTLSPQKLQVLKPIKYLPPPPKVKVVIFWVVDLSTLIVRFSVVMSVCLSVCLSRPVLR